MAATKRLFRTQEGIDAEAISRDAVAPFLKSRGYIVEDDQRHTFGTAISQDVFAIDPDGKRIKMRVRLCWRWDRKNKDNNCSAAQLRARHIDNDWDQTLDTIVAPLKEKGITHMMLMQRSGEEVV